MADANEEIVKLWLEGEGYAVETCVQFTSQKGTKGGAGPSDIDILAIFRKQGKTPPYGRRLLIQVKGWFNFGKKLKKTIKPVKQYYSSWLSKAAVKCAGGYFGTKKFKTIKTMWVQPLAEDSQGHRQKLKCLFGKLKKGNKISKAVDHIIDFKAVLNQVFKSVDKGTDYKGKPILQAFRLIKIYTKKEE